jgi:hypothetical protein
MRSEIQQDLVALVMVREHADHVAAGPGTVLDREHDRHTGLVAN